MTGLRILRGPPLAPPLNAGPDRLVDDTLLVRQLFDSDSSTFTYLLRDPTTSTAVIIDPVLEKADRDASLAAELGLDLRMALNTHCHADHITGSHALKQRFPRLRSGISRSSGCAADELLDDGDEVWFGGSMLKVIYTPGHTKGCASFYWPDRYAVFTGDTLLIRGCGRTDFQDGDARRLFRSIHGRLFRLPPATTVYPAHDYNGRVSSTIGEERVHNARLGRDEADFVGFMRALNLPRPRLMDIAVPRNTQCGV